MADNGSASPLKAVGQAYALPGATSALVLLLCINLFNFMDRQVLSAVEPEIREHILEKKISETKSSPAAKELQESQADGGEEESLVKFWSGLLVFAFLITYMFLAPVFGWLADHVSRWLLVGFGVIIWSIASAASGFDWVAWFGVSLGAAYWLLFATRCLVGFGEAAYGPVAPAMISDLYPVEQRGKVMSWFYMAIPVGGALGFTLGDLMLAENGGPGWRWAFYAVMPPGILLGLLCFFRKELPRGQVDAQQREERTEENPSRPAVRKAKLRDYLVLLKIRSYMLNVVGMTCLMFAIGGLAHWMPELLEQRSEEEFGPLPPRMVFGLIVAGGGFIATLLGGIAGDYFRQFHSGAYFLVSAAAMILGFPMIIIALYVPFPWAWLFIFFGTFGLFFNTAPTNTINANVTHPSIRASAFGFNILVTHLLGDAISPAIIGLVQDYSNLNMGFIVVASSMLVGGIFWIWGAFYLGKDTQLAPTRLSLEES
ncbi:MAG: spinster family MFS transporter [Gemmataceae bacterium]